jgi:hypothetical protein
MVGQPGGKGRKILRDIDLSLGAEAKPRKARQDDLSLSTCRRGGALQLRQIVVDPAA